MYILSYCFHCLSSNLHTIFTHRLVACAVAWSTAAAITQLPTAHLNNIPRNGGPAQGQKKATAGQWQNEQLVDLVGIYD